MRKREFSKRIQVEDANAREEAASADELEDEMETMSEIDSEGAAYDAENGAGSFFDGSAGPSVDAQAGSEESEATIDLETFERLKSEAENNYDKYLRAIAELENYKKRAVKERSDLIRYGGEGMARDLLTVLDDLHRALEQSQGEQNSELFRGVQMILEQFVGTFERHGIRAEESKGMPFDPGKHEAVASVPTDEHAPGTVMEEFRKAYYFRDRLLRPAQVVVAQEKKES